MIHMNCQPMHLNDGYEEYARALTPEDKVYNHTGHLTAYESILHAGTAELLSGCHVSDICHLFDI